MPSANHETTLARQWELLKLLPSRGPGTTSRDLRDRLEHAGHDVSKRTVERDLSELSRVFPILSNEISKPFGWHWKPGARVDFPGIDLAEAVSLGLLEDLLRQMIPPSFTESLEGRFAAAREKLKSLSQNRHAKWSDLICYEAPGLPLHKPSIKPGVSRAVQEALIRKLQLKVHYRGPGSTTNKELLLHPLAIIQKGERAYLLATTFDYADVLYYALHRMHAAELLDDPAKRPAHFALDTFLAQGGGQFGDGKTISLKAHLSDNLTGILRETAIASETVFQIGHQVGEIARCLYDPEGTGVTIDIEDLGHSEALAQSAVLLSQGLSPIFEAGVTIDGALAYADVMLPDPQDGELAWKMIEVKSSGSVKDYQRDDIAVQAHIANASGLRLSSVSLAHIDGTFVYPGDGDYRGLLKENDLTEEAFARSEEVREWIVGAQAVVALPDEPEVETGAQCTAPFTCGFCDYCNRDKVVGPTPEYPLSSLPNFHWRKHELMEELGIEDLRNVPDKYLSDRQAVVKEHTIAGTVFFDAEGAAADLLPHGFPAYFLDFETIRFTVPVWKHRQDLRSIIEECAKSPSNPLAGHVGCQGDHTSQEMEFSDAVAEVLEHFKKQLADSMAANGPPM